MGWDTIACIASQTILLSHVKLLNLHFFSCKGQKCLFEYQASPKTRDQKFLNYCFGNFRFRILKKGKGSASTSGDPLRGFWVIFGVNFWFLFFVLRHVLFAMLGTVKPGMHLASSLELLL